jgi:hypothetical protein
MVVNLTLRRSSDDHNLRLTSPIPETDGRRFSLFIAPLPAKERHSVPVLTVFPARSLWNGGHFQKN